MLHTSKGSRGTKPLSDLEEVDLLVSTIAVVFDPTSQPPPVNVPSDLTGIIRQPVNVSGNPLGQLTITSTRDQIELLLSGNRFEVRDLSGTLDQGVAKIPRIVHEVMALLGNPRLSSYGINFVLEMPKQEARNWLVTTLLSPSIQERLEGELSSNHVNLILHRQSKTLTTQLASGVADKIGVNFNASQETPELPNAEHLRDDMKEQYGALIGLLERLGG